MALMHACWPHCISEQVMVTNMQSEKGAMASIHAHGSGRSTQVTCLPMQEILVRNSIAAVGGKDPAV